MAAPVVANTAGHTNNSSAASQTIAKPAGTASGDLLVAIIALGNAASLTITPPAGWSEIAQISDGAGTPDTKFGLFYLVAGVSEPASYTFSFSGTSRSVSNIIRITGADATNPINVAASGNSGVSLSTSHAAPSVTTTVADCLLLCAAASRAAQPLTVPAGMTEVWNGTPDTVALSRADAAIASEVVSSAGTTGTRTFTTSTNDNTALVSFAVAPASGGGGGVTGTLSATESGADAASMSGSVAWPAVTGTLAVAETGVDSAAFGGAVLVAGSLAANETGQDGSSATGSVLVAGALQASEAGPDTAALAGAVLVSGALSAQETGNDNLAGQGGVLVVGTLSAGEQGADTFAGFGLAPEEVAGTLAATESGSDTALVIGAVRVSGSLSVAEVGSDAADFGGAVSWPGVVGSLAAIEAANDNAEFVGAVEIAGTLAAQEDGQDTFIGGRQIVRRKAAPRVTTFGAGPSRPAQTQDFVRHGAQAHHTRRRVAS